MQVELTPPRRLRASRLRFSQALERPATSPGEVRCPCNLRSAKRSDCLSAANFQTAEMLRARRSAAGRVSMLPKVQSHMKRRLPWLVHYTRQFDESEQLARIFGVLAMTWPARGQLQLSVQHECVNQAEGGVSECFGQRPTILKPARCHSFRRRSSLLRTKFNCIAKKPRERAWFSECSHIAWAMPRPVAEGETTYTELATCAPPPAWFARRK